MSFKIALPAQRCAAPMRLADAERAPSFDARPHATSIEESLTHETNTELL